MVVFIFCVGALLCGLGAVAFVGSLPVVSRNTPLKEAFSQIFKDKKTRISFCCFIAGSLIVMCFLILTA